MHKIRFAVLAALCLLLFARAFAGDAPPTPDPKLDFVQRPGGITYAVPKAGPLRFKTLEEQGARFSGRIRMTGTYLYGHTSNDPNDELVDEPQLYFLPDKETLALLPYCYERGPVVEVYFENEAAFLSAVIAPKLVADVKRRRVHAITGHAAIWVDNYFATAECDHPQYVVRFLTVDQPPALVARNEFVEQQGCG